MGLDWQRHCWWLAAEDGSRLGKVIWQHPVRDRSEVASGVFKHGSAAFVEQIFGDFSGPGQGSTARFVEQNHVAWVWWCRSPTCASFALLHEEAGR